MNKAKVSIIIPVYNVESYIAKCLDSLVNQALKDIEIIIVNDGSTDNSQSILDKYARKYSNIKIISKKNEGAASARNYGLEIAKAEYIAFVDSDDYIEKDMLKTMYDEAKSKDLDIVLCGINYVYTDKQEIVLPLENKEITPNNCILTAPAPWNKMFKKEFLDKIDFKFDSGIIYEDFAVIPSTFIHKKKIGYINEPYYNYLTRMSSVSNPEKYTPKLNDIFIACDNLYNRFKGHPEYNNELEQLFIAHLMYNASFRFYSFEESKKQILKISDIMREKFPKWQQNAYVNNFSKKEKFILKMFYEKKIGVVDLLTKMKRLVRK